MLVRDDWTDQEKNAVYDALLRTRTLLETPEQWTRGCFEVYRNGHRCRCLLGALYVAVNLSVDLPETSKLIRARAAIGHAIGDLHGTPGVIRNLVRFNDAEARSHAQILEVLDLAISWVAPVAA